jgi:hypothetical protein
VAVTSVTPVYQIATIKPNNSLIGSVATVETSPATASHAVGSYIIWNNQMYEVTSAISVGETLVVGSNISATDVGTEISDLKSDLNTIHSAGLYSSSNIESGECSYVLSGKQCTVDAIVKITNPTSTIVFTGLPMTKIQNSPLVAITGANDTGGYYCYINSSLIYINATRAGIYRIGGSYIVQ